MSMFCLARAEKDQYRYFCVSNRRWQSLTKSDDVTIPSTLLCSSTTGKQPSLLSIKYCTTTVSGSSKPNFCTWVSITSAMGVKRSFLSNAPWPYLLSMVNTTAIIFLWVSIPMNCPVVSEITGKWRTLRVYIN